MKIKVLVQNVLKWLENRIRVDSLQDEFKRIGVNFVTAGVVGVFINHFVGSKLSTMFWASTWITFGGVFCLFLGLIQRGNK